MAASVEWSISQWIRLSIVRSLLQSRFHLCLQVQHHPSYPNVQIDQRTQSCCLSCHFLLQNGMRPLWMAFDSPVPVPLFRETQDVLVDSSEGLLYWFPSGYLSSRPSWVRRSDSCHRMQLTEEDASTTRSGQIWC